MYVGGGGGGGGMHWDGYCVFHFHTLTWPSLIRRGGERRCRQSVRGNNTSALLSVRPSVCVPTRLKVILSVDGGRGRQNGQLFATR